ncbi:MAG: hypothetical protein ACJAQ4_001135 [Cryomorphaceae bacterium]|jgi:hypothetical protein
MATGLTLGIIALPPMFFALVPSIMHYDPCEYESSFRQTECNVSITKRYNDTPNCNYETVEI